MATNKEYWKERQLEIEQAVTDIGEETINGKLRTLYNQTEKELNNIVNDFYQKYAIDNKVTTAEARKLLKDIGLTGLEEDLRILRDKAQTDEFKAIVNEQLELVKARKRVMRVEAVQFEINANLNLLDEGNQLILDESMRNTYATTFNMSSANFQKASGMSVTFKIDETQVKKILTMDWVGDGKNFSDRIHDDVEKLKTEVYKEMSQGFIRGDSNQKMISAISKKVTSSRKNIERIVRTEGNFVSNQGMLDTYDNYDVDKYQILATIDARTSDICSDMNGREFDVTKSQVGINYPPFHPNCRTTTIPVVDF